VDFDEDNPALRSYWGAALGFRPAGGGRPALRSRSAPWPGATGGDDRPHRRRVRTPRYRRSATTAGAHGALIRALKAKVGDSWQLLESGAVSWASAMFVGERHRLVVEAAEGALAEIETWEFDIPGQVVADIVVAGRSEAGFVIEALTIGEH
jgi:hypothetical protein